MKTVKLTDATPHQLRMWCMQHLGEMPPPNTKPETMIAKLRVLGREELDVLEETSANGSVGQRTPAASASVEPPRTVDDYLKLYPKGVPELTGQRDPVVMLLIPHQDKPGGDRDVFVAVNGTSFLIPRSKTVPVPWRYYVALRNAIEANYHADPQDITNLIRTDTPAYPIQVMSMPPREWIEAWERAQGIGTIEDGEGEAMDPAIVALLASARAVVGEARR